MRQTFMAGAAFAMMLAGTASASAADMVVPQMASRAPPSVVAPAHSWTACYIGAHGGYGWGRKAWNFTDSFPAMTEDSATETQHNATGGLAGGQVGCDWQNDRWVFGIEGQMSWARLDGDSNAVIVGDGGAAIAPTNFSTRVGALGVVVGKLGLTLDRTLLYVNGGLAFAKDRHQLRFEGDDVFYQADNLWRVGWTVGGGVEHALDHNWSLKLEYSYMHFGRKDVHFAPVCTEGVICVASYDIRIDQHIHAVKFGVNYRFGPRPVVARY